MGRILIEIGVVEHHGEIRIDWTLEFEKVGRHGHLTVHGVVVRRRLVHFAHFVVISYADFVRILLMLLLLLLLLLVLLTIRGFRSVAIAAVFVVCLILAA